MNLADVNASCEKPLTLETRNHSFNVGIARDFSPDTALWIGHLAFWSERNLSLKKHIHDGLVWSYNTLDALKDCFPYFSRRQIERIINHSIKEGLVQKGNYNQTKYDRTVWYALTPKAYFYFPHLATEKYLELMFSTISPNGEMDFSKWGNGFRQTVTPIPDTDPDTDPHVCGGEPAQHTKNSSSKTQTPENPLHAEELKKQFDEKFSGYLISYEQLLEECEEYYATKLQKVTPKKWNLWIEREKLDHYKKINPTKNVPEHPYTNEEIELVKRYKAASQYLDKYPERLDTLMPDKKEQKRAQELIKNMESECPKNTPKKNAKRKYSALGLNSVSRLS